MRRIQAVVINPVATHLGDGSLLATNLVPQLWLLIDRATIGSLQDTMDAYGVGLGDYFYVSDDPEEGPSDGL